MKQVSRTPPHKATEYLRWDEKNT